MFSSFRYFNVKNRRLQNFAMVHGWNSNQVSPKSGHWDWYPKGSVVKLLLNVLLSLIRMAWDYIPPLNRLCCRNTTESRSQILCWLSEGRICSHKNCLISCTILKAKFSGKLFFRLIDACMDDSKKNFGLNSQDGFDLMNSIQPRVN
jgi:hypothetical protein